MLRSNLLAVPVLGYHKRKRAHAFTVKAEGLLRRQATFYL